MPVEGFHRASYVDAPFLADATFDVLLCLGGPLNYRTELASDAVAQVQRVTRPGGGVASQR